ncbi:MAG TPA: hypothetical protein VMI56_28030 [Reyranella sp.]|nr:hypothetical protein [Reyranella sp.]
MRAALTACVLALLAAGSAAAQEQGCRQFSWSVGREIDLFDEPLPVVQSALSLPRDGVFVLLLKPVADVIYIVAPERGRDSGYGGFITLENIPAGRYQIAVSEEAWIDAVQHDTRITPLASETAKGCPGVRRSLDIEAAGEPLTVQVSGASVQRLKIAVVRVWPFEWRW